MSPIRSAGILLHITSLPNRFGIGDFGRTAFEFVDFLCDAGQSVWQILPLCPTTQGNSPYSSYSAFGGNMLLLSPEAMVAEGWLTQKSLEGLVREYESALSAETDKVDFELVTRFKRRLLSLSFEQSRERLPDDPGYQAYCTQQGWWLDDFSKFEALWEHLGETDWTRWPAVYKNPNDVPVAVIEQIKVDIEFSKYKQFLFDGQWDRLKKYANQKNISICGDMPIFVALESADVWANQTQFLLDQTGNPQFVAGVPPDYFSATGQFWNNPLYDWDAMESDGFAWWCDRFRRALDQFDYLRVDHFRGFDQYWKIPADAKSAVEGTWAAGPKDKPFVAARQALGDLPIWAEDLGDIDQSVHDLRDRLGFPTMRVLQFGYSDPEDDFHRHTSIHSDCIAYTGTHDNDTLMGWFNDRKSMFVDGRRDVLTDFINEDQQVHWQIIQLLYQSPARVVIVPMQDVIGLGTAARMNRPGVAEGNWSWRCTQQAITPDIAKQLRNMVDASHRVPETRLSSTIQ